jgi:hypothetical protein
MRLLEAGTEKERWKIDTRQPQRPGEPFLRRSRARGLSPYERARSAMVSKLECRRSTELMSRRQR